MGRSVAILGAALTACGTDAGDNTLVYPDETRCLSCDARPHQDEQVDLEAAPRVFATPDLLMFYPESTTSDLREVVVTNAMGYLVFVTSGGVVDSTTSDGDGGSDYFLVDAIEEHIRLEHGESASLWVEFLGSERQRSALLIIHTTSPSNHTLTVELTGKSFIDG